jgi:hypothetical protein
MIINNLMLKLKNRDDNSISSVKEELLSMKDNIGSLIDIEVQTNIRKGPSNYDIILITSFKSPTDLETYLIHPFHINLSENIIGKIDESAAVCYESLG